MKKIYTLLLDVAIVSTITAQNVVLTYSNHALSPDNDNQMKLTRWVSPGSGGENQLWDFSNLEEVKDFEGYVRSSYEVDVENVFPESNVALNEFGNKFYFKLNEESLEQYGMTSSSGTVSIEYDRPYVKMKYPFAYGNSFSGTYGGTYKSSSLEVSLDGSYEVEADGYGKLILPNGVEVDNTLRVVTKRSYTRNFTNPNEIEITTYRWYNETERFPLLVLTTIKSTTNGKSSTSHQAAFRESVATSVETIDAELFDVKIYPNPFQDQFAINYKVEKNADILIELFDNTGKKIETLVENKLQEGNYTYRYNSKENNLSQGIYFINYSVNSKLSLTQKIVLAK